MTQHSGYEHVWPELQFGWKIVVGTMVGFLGAAFGTAGGVGGGGIFIMMLHLIIGFDPKSSAAISKCMIAGAACATMCYNLKQRHPALDMPLIDYEIALLFQPMLVMGVGMGVVLNVILADWMINLLVLVFFSLISARAFFRGVKTWKKETISKVEASMESNEEGDKEAATVAAERKQEKVSILKNVQWKELGLLLGVWLTILGLHIGKNHTKTCSVTFWILNVVQIPVAGAVTLYQAIRLNRRPNTSRGQERRGWKIYQLVFYCAVGIIAGVVGAMLGIGGGFIMGPLLLEMGFPPEVASATSTFVLAFSSSMSAIQYFLLKHFPVPYALYFFGVATVAGFAGQKVIKRLIQKLGRASIVIFILSFIIFISGMSVGGIGIADMVKMIKQNEYMGFDEFCPSSQQ